MHVTTKDVVQDKEAAELLGLALGTHLLTTVLEADGAFELVSAKGSISATVLSQTRTSSGGIEVKVAVSVSEPAPVETPKPEPQPTVEDQAIAYLKSKGLKEDEAKAAVEKYGADKILLRRTAEFDSELDALVK